MNREIDLIYYIDPMSYNNLAVYDYSLLSNIQCKYVFWGNVKYNFTGINIKRVFKYSNYSNHILKSISYLLTIVLIFISIVRNKPGVVHIQWFKLYRFDLFWLKLVKKITVCEIVYTVHNILPHDSGNRYKKVFNNIYAIVDKIIIHTQSSKMDLLEIFPKVQEEKIFVIPHGVLKINSECPENDEKIRLDFNLSRQLVFSFLGGLNNYKGIDIFAEAIKLFNRDINNGETIQFLVAGRGEVEKELDSYFKNDKSISYHNRFFSDKEFSQLLKVTDCLILPYRQISQSGLLLSALQLKLPVITSGVGGLSEPFSIANIGWIVTSNKPKDYSDLFKNITASVLANIRNNKNGWKKINNYYSWERIGKMTMVCYNTRILK